MTDLSQTKMVVARYDINTTGTLYSSVLGLLRHYTLSLFPEDFFKHIYIKNSMHSVTAAKDDDDSRATIEKPNLSINMNLDPQDSSFNGDAFMFGNMHVLRNAWGYPHIYSRIAWDQNEKIYITALPVRAKNSFDIGVQVNSEIQALNIIGYLRSKLGINRPVFLNRRFIEVPLPPSIIGSIAAARKVNLNDSQERNDFNTILTKISDGRITYKLHKSSGKFMYFYKYSTNLMFKVTNFDSIENELQDKSVLSSTVKFNVEIEYDTHINFISESYQNLPPPTYGEFIFTDIGFGSLMHLTINQVVISQLEDGKKVVFATDIITDVNELLDITEFEPFMNSYIVKYMKTLGSIEEVKNKFTAKLFRDGTELKQDTVDEPGDFTVDWETLTLTVNTPRLNYDHRFAIYADVAELNAFKDSLMPKPNI